MLLVTDFGFLNELGHVWHVLCDIDDSGDFLDANFQISPSSQSVDVPEIVNTTSTGNRYDNRIIVQYSTVQYSTVQYSMVRYSMVRYSTVQYGNSIVQ